MCPSSQFRAVIAAAAVCTLTSASLGQEGSGGARPFAKAPLEVSVQPLYATAPAAAMGAPASAGSEPVLVPLPPGVWAAVSGLAGLAVAAVWRKHRLREE
jgi:hypothetical protein